MKEVDIISKVVGRDTSGKTAMYIPGAGAPSVNLDDYLLKKIWDSVFEIRTDSEGNPYLFEKMPFVTQYGITMYADGGDLNLPSIYAGLPIDGRTLIRDDNGVLMINPDIDLGGGLTEVYWNDIKAKPTFATVATSGKYADLNGLPDLSAYATTEYLTAELKKYVTLNTEQTIAAHKNFLNGLSVGGLGITKSRDDVVYIDANLVVRGGITMYAEGEVDIPSILDSLPIASTTAKGIASFDSSYFSVDSDGKVTLLAENVGLNETELFDYLSRNNYAKKSDIPSLSGYATETYVEDRLDDLINGAPAAYDTLKEIADVLAGNVDSIGDIITTLGTKADKAIKISAGTGLSGGGTLEADRTLSLATSGVTAGTYKSVAVDKYGRVTSGTNPTTLADYGITDAYTKTKVDELLSLYVTLAGTQTITGEKNFTGGLKVNGSPIVYDATNKYWKLEGDLLVTGGVTMYANEGTYTPSTIMDALLLDGATLGINDEGQLYVKGGTGGGVADSVAWENVTGKPSFAAVATSGKYSDLSGVPTLLSSFTDDVVAGKYLPLNTSTTNILTSSQSGVLNFKSTSSKEVGIRLYFNDTNGGGLWYSDVQGMYLYNSASVTQLGLLNDGTPYYQDLTSNKRHLWHSGNFNPSNYLPLSGGQLSNSVTGLFINRTTANANPHICFRSQGISIGDIGINYDGTKPIWYNYNTKTWNDIITSDNAANYNVGSATKLQTARTIWGQSFDGTGNVSGALTGVTDITASGTINISTKATIGTGVNTLNNTFNVLGSTALGGNVTIFDSSLAGSLNNGSGKLYFNSSNYDKGVFIQGINVASYGRKRLGIFVNNEESYNATTWVEALTVRETGNVGIGTTSPTVNLQVNGSARVSQIDLGHGNEINGYSSDNEVSPTSIHINYRSSGNVTLALGGGNVGIGTKSPSDLLHLVKEKYEDLYVTCTNAVTNYSVGFGIGGSGINRGIWDYTFSKWLLYADADKTNLTNNVWINQDAWDNGLMLNRTAANGGCGISVYSNGTKLGVFGINGSQTLEFSIFANNVNNQKFTVDKNGNGLFYGGITMYSDIRKKTKLADVELSLKQIADAPLIEHYYNSDAMRTTHVGSIAQYWAGLNDWFCKLDGEGFYTMEIQNAALASAISIARELVKYESKTDRKIRLLKQRVKELEDKIEQLEIK